MSAAVACAKLAVMTVRTKRTVMTIRIAIFHVNAAIRYANKEGFPSSSRAPLFRMVNWLRADLRKMQGVA
jgi:hypothetical protein